MQLKTAGSFDKMAEGQAWQEISPASMITIRSFFKCGIAVLTTGEQYNEINISANWSLQ